METHTLTDDSLAKTVECKVIDLAKTPKCPRCGGYRTKRTSRIAVCYACDNTWLLGDGR